MADEARLGIILVIKHRADAHPTDDLPLAQSRLA
jgi:hypothetical protein